MCRISRAATAVVLALACATRAHAANRFSFDDRTVAAGAIGAEFAVRADNDVALYGFSFGVNYDPTALTVTLVTIAGTDAASAEYFDGRVDTARGLVGYGCVLDLSEPLDKMIVPGTDRTIAKLVANVIGAAGTSSQLIFEPVSLNPDPLRIVKNVMTTTQGVTVVPSLTPGTITIDAGTPAPVITSIANNTGLAGQVFQVQGDFFDEPGLQVRVCSAAAAATLRGDGRTLDVTAPVCAVEGAVEVEVCTVGGCDGDPEGFTYLPEDIPFIRGDANNDLEVDISDGVRILVYLFIGGIATSCPDAFDATDTDIVDVSDAIFIFQYLFSDGPVIPPPFPDEGRDPTPDDTLAKCLGRP